MRVLAIDTALAACAATVLDTDHGIVASESLPMVRGHAEALIPLWSRTTKHASNSSTDHGGGKRRAVNLALWLRDAFPSAVRSYQALTFYPALAYGVDNNRIGSANFIGVGNRGLSGIVYRIKVACGRSKQRRHTAWGGRFSKIADPKFHARKIKRQWPISNGKSSA